MNLSQRILGPEEYFSLEDRTMNTVLFFSLGVILSSLVSDLFLKHSFLFPLGMFFFYGTLYTLGRRKARHKKLLFPFYAGAFISLIWIWYRFDGFGGSVLLFSLSYMVITPVVTRKWTRNLILLGFVLAVCVLAYVDIHYPDLPDAYPDDRTRIIDNVVAAMYLATAMVLVIRIILKSHRKQKDKINELSQSKGQFMAVIAHDVKGSISGLVGMAEMLERSDPSHLEARKKIEGLILDASRLSYELLENLLQWARSDSGLMVPKPSRVPLREMVETNLHLLGDQITGKEINIVLDMDPKLSGHADMNMCDTIIRNLLSNAVKFTRKGGEIKVSGTPLPGKTQVALSVNDNGIGMDPTTLKQIFDMETKVSKEGTFNERGTGLGLKLCKEFISKNGGHIEVDSQEGMGSEFTIYLPEAKKT